MAEASTIAGWWLRLAQEVEVLLARRKVGRAVSPGSTPAPDVPAGTDMIPELGHIVVVMMENHSYDNYLGTLERGDGLDADAGGDPSPTNPATDGRPIRAHHLTSTTQHIGVPTQSWEASHQQWNAGANDGFVTNAASQPSDVDPEVAMGYWDDSDLPFYHGLARTFPLADRWFSSCLGPTIPNRRFLVAGTANGLVTDSLGQMLDHPANGTIFDVLNRHRISWVDYHPVAHWRPVLSRLAGERGIRAGRRLRWSLRSSVARIRGAEGEAKAYLQFTADAYPSGLLHYVRHVRSIERFEADAAAGTLPAVSIVDPDFRATSEENPQDIRVGEAFAARVINAAMRGRGWSRTLLVWVYDEHGGYYDHVAPPPAPEPDDRRPEGGGRWSYDRYGFRVPAVIVSPYARPGYVSHEIHDHTSILKLIETKWNLPPLTRRDAAADNLLDSVDFSSPPAFAEPPILPEPAQGSYRGSQAPSGRGPEPVVGIEPTT
jgi:phospholipase C